MLVGVRTSLSQKARPLAADSSDKLHPLQAAVEAHFATSEKATDHSKYDRQQQKKRPLQLPSDDFRYLAGSQMLVEKDLWGVLRAQLRLLFQFPLSLGRYEYQSDWFGQFDQVGCGGVGEKSRTPEQ